MWHFVTIFVTYSTLCDTYYVALYLKARSAAGSRWLLTPKNKREKKKKLVKMVWVKPLLLPQQLLSTDYLLTLHVGTKRRHNTSITTNSKENTKKKVRWKNKAKQKQERSCLNKNDSVWIILQVLSFFVWNQRSPFTWLQNYRIFKNKKWCSTPKTQKSTYTHCLKIIEFKRTLNECD